jgi:hypothetical protein
MAASLPAPLRSMILKRGRAPTRMRKRVSAVAFGGSRSVISSGRVRMSASPSDCTLSSARSSRQVPAPMLRMRTTTSVVSPWVSTARRVATVSKRRRGRNGYTRADELGGRSLSVAPRALVKAYRSHSTPLRGISAFTGGWFGARRVNASPALPRTSSTPSGGSSRATLRANRSRRRSTCTSAKYAQS